MLGLILFGSVVAFVIGHCGGPDITRDSFSCVFCLFSGLLLNVIVVLTLRQQPAEEDGRQTMAL